MHILVEEGLLEFLPIRVGSVCICENKFKVEFVREEMCVKERGRGP
jgi:hypothetical protein